RFLFGIYFADPLDVKMNKENNRRYDGITIVPPEKRTLKIFNGLSFSNTCYYNWDQEGHVNGTYNRDAFLGLDMQLIPGDENSWHKLDSIFPKVVRDVHK